MPYILTRRVRTSQPQTIEKTKPSFTVGSLLLPASFLREPQSGALFTNVNGVFLSPSAGGLGYHCDKSAQRYLIGMPLPVIGSAYSFVAVVNSTGTDTNYSEIFQSIKQSNGTGLLQLRHTASNWDFYHCSTSSWQLVQGVGKYKQGVPQVLVGTWDGDNIKLWIDGEYIGSVAASGWFGSEAPSSLSIGVDISAWSPIGGTYWDGDINLFAFSSGPIWPDAVAKSISGNPWQIFDDEEEYIWVPEAGGDVTVALTGQSYTLSQGTHDVGLSKSVTGQSYTHTQGTLSASVSTSATVALTGQSYTLSQGSLTKGTSKALTGQSYTLSQGDLGVSTSATVALTGQSYTLSQGAFGVSAGSGSTVELTNQTYTISQGTLGVSTSATVALTGQTYALSQGAPLPTLDLGLANQTISYTQGTLGVSVGATVALTGQIYTHTQGTLGVSVGNNVTVALTGQDLNYSQGTFAPGVALAIAGQTYSLSQGTLAVVVGNNATVALTGQSYALTQGLVGVAATVGLTGQYISFAQGTLGVTTDTNYYVSLTGQSYTLSQGTLGVTNDTNYIVPLTGQSYTYSQRAPSVLGATIPLSEMRLYVVPPEDRRYTVSTY